MAVLKYPHMMPAEVPIWERWLSQYGKDYSKFDYDVHVGEGITTDPTWQANIATMAKILTQKRIDAVGYIGDRRVIFEVKPDAGLSALGQLIAYRDLYLRDTGYKGPLYLAVVTDNILPDETFVYEKNGIKVYVV